MDSLDERTRALVAATCARRAELELHGAAAFTVITQDLIDLRADARILELSARAVAEEVAHSNAYLELARTYGAPPRVLRASPIETPRYAGVTPDGERMLRVVAMCSINETMACSFLELCLAGAKVAAARDAIRGVLEDEIRHARIGWAYLGSRDAGDDARRIVSKWLPLLLRTQWVSWREQIATLPDLDAPEHGCPSGAAIERASLASMRELVLPGFEQAGVDVGEALRWLDAGAT